MLRRFAVLSDKGHQARELIRRELSYLREHLSIDRKFGFQWAWATIGFLGAISLALSVMYLAGIIGPIIFVTTLWFTPAGFAFGFYVGRKSARDWENPL